MTRTREPRPDITHPRAGYCRTCSILGAPKFYYDASACYKQSHDVSATREPRLRDGCLIMSKHKPKPDITLGPAEVVALSEWKPRYVYAVDDSPTRACAVWGCLNKSVVVVRTAKPMAWYGSCLHCIVSKLNAEEEVSHATTR